MRNRTDVLDFLAPIDRASSYISFAEAFVDAAADPDSGPAVRRAFHAVKARLRDPSRPLLNVEQARICDRIRRGRGYDAAGKSAMQVAVEPLVVALYVRATALLSTHGTSPVLADLPEAMKLVEPALAKMDDDIFGEVIVEAELKASRDRRFAVGYAAAAEEVREIGDQLSHLEPQWQVALDNDSDEDCACIGHGCNANGDCMDFCLGFWDCLLIIFGIVLLVVLG